MLHHTFRSRFLHLCVSPARAIGWILFAAVASALSFQADAQQDSTNQPAPQTNSQPAAQSAATAQNAPTTTPDSTPPTQSPTPETPATDQPAPTATPPADNPPPQSPNTSAAENATSPEPVQHHTPPWAGGLHLLPSREINQDEVKQLLVGKQLFIRSGYLENALSFNENGSLIGHSEQGSYTLNAIEIDKVHLSRHKVELEGERYALHFLGALPSEDPASAFDRVNITPKKKIVKITIDREIVVKLKQPKEKKKSSKGDSKMPVEPLEVAPAVASSTPDPSQQSAPAAEQSATQPASSAASSQPSGGSEAPPETAGAPPEEGPADPKSVTTTTSPAHANQVLLDALDNVFAQPFDPRMMDAMPGFWKLYYDAATAKTDYRPKDPSVLRQSMVDQKAKLVSTFEPPSNEYAQDKGVAGMALYHVIVGADGKPGEVAVARPIGFGLDENAVDSIGKATFSPAIKGGKPVPVILDLVVQFRIYSKRTSQASISESAGQDVPVLPGPYSVRHQHQ